MLIIKSFFFNYMGLNIKFFFFFICWILMKKYLRIKMIFLIFFKKNNLDFIVKYKDFFFN